MPIVHLEEAEFPRVYLLYFMLQHGEKVLEGLKVDEDKMPTARALENALAGKTMYGLAKYIYSHGPTEVPVTFKRIDKMAVELGLYEPFI